METLVTQPIIDVIIDPTLRFLRVLKSESEEVPPSKPPTRDPPNEYDSFFNKTSGDPLSHVDVRLWSLSRASSFADRPC